MSLDKIRMVLVETTHPGNIGAAARAMKVMGLSRLYLVTPQHFPSAEATSRASGADDILAAARVVESLDQALEGCSLVFGASARHRSLPWPLLEPRAAAQTAGRAALGGEEVAVVFGREHSGLSNSELERCNSLLHIPANPDYSSLNLAAAVQVVAYELRQAALAMVPAAEEEEADYATADELEGLYAHLEQTMIEVEFLDPDNPRQVMRRLRRLFNRARLERSELNILRGVLTACQKRAG